MITKQEILHAFYYKDWGFFWKNPRSNSCKKGDRAGSRNKKGYWAICLSGRIYMAHHLVWFLETGNWPTEIDHKDRNPSNNSIENLREITRTLNQANAKLSSRSTTGYRGVTFNKQRSTFVAKISIGGKTKHLGCFDTVEEAAKVADEARLKEWGQFYQAATSSFSGIGASGAI